jgi:hypothetical protein
MGPAYPQFFYLALSRFQDLKAKPVFFHHLSGVRNATE